MQVEVLPDTDSVACRAAELLVAVVAEGATTLALSTGQSPVKIYRRLAESPSRREIMQRCQVFMLDELEGLEVGHPGSYASYVDTHIAPATGVRRESVRLPPANAEDSARASERFENDIAKAGGIDAALIGLGTNGHIAFNEPGSSLKSKTRRVSLDDSTRAANRCFFEGLGPVPTHAVTMGVETILSAHHIILVATGSHKAPAVAAVVDGPVTSRVPGSALQRHESVVAIVDKDAARQLELIDNSGPTRAHSTSGRDCPAS